MDYVAGRGAHGAADRRHRGGHRPRLPRARHGAGGRRDGADAGTLPRGHFDLAGTIIGVVEEDEALHGDQVRAGRRAAGLRLHRAAHQRLHPGAAHRVRARRGSRSTTLLGDTGAVGGRRAAGRAPELRAGLVPVLGQVHALAHITGGGIAGNLVRVLPERLQAVVEPRGWEWPPLFRFLQQAGEVGDGGDARGVQPRHRDDRACCRPDAVATWRGRRRGRRASRRGSSATVRAGRARRALRDAE